MRSIKSIVGARQTITVDALTTVADAARLMASHQIDAVPVLDGGRLAFLGWEAISRRKVNQRIEQTIHMVGVLALLLLLVVISFKNDLHLTQWLHR